jgi:hypothetical protein
MDVTKVKAAIATAHEELNKVLDAQFKDRQVNGLRTLGLAANALELAEKHLDKAVEQAKPKEVAQPAPAADGKKTGGKK